MRKLLLTILVLFELLLISNSILASKERLYANEDNGWQVVYTLSDNSIYLKKIFFLNENTGYAVGTNGTILKTTDGGNIWTSKNSGVTNTLYDIHFVNNNIGYAVGTKDNNGELVIKTVDGGDSWTRLTLDNAVDKRNFYGLYFTDENNGYVVGEWGTIIKTTDGGSNWTRSSHGKHLLDITFVNSTTGFAVGNDSQILKTTDSGENWVSKSSGNAGIAEVFFLNENEGFIAGLGNTLEKTTDGGENWSTIAPFPIASDNFYSVCFTSSNVGYFSGIDEEGAEVFGKTTNGGSSWNVKVESHLLESLVFPSELTGFAVSNNAIYKYSAEVVQTATINGKVTNAIDGTAIAGALVEIAGLSTTTDENGNYEITNIPEATLNAAFSATPLSGNAPLQVSFTDQSNDAAYSLVVSATGFSTYTNNQIIIDKGDTLAIDVSLSPMLNAGEMRIVLNWGDAPDDLDSYLVTPTIDGSSYTIDYSNKGSASVAPYATLDHDDRDAYGPETITIYQKFAGTYKYYVNNYSGTPDITSSNAVVQVYTNEGLVSSVNVPTTGSGAYWNVLTIDGATGNISVINEISDNAPTAILPELPRKPINLAKTEILRRGTESITSWNWMFGDGETSNEQNPTHTYTSPGVYTVRLTVSNGTDSNTELKLNYITATAPVTGDTIYSTLDGGSWQDTLTWIGNKTPTLNDNVVIQGPVIVNSPWPASFDFECKSLTVRDSLICSDDGPYDNVQIKVHGDINNNGVIAIYNLSELRFYIDGDFFNNNIADYVNLIFRNSATHTLSSLFPFTYIDIEMENGENLIAGSNLSFVDSYLQFNNGKFIVDDGKTISFYSTEGGTGNGRGHIDKTHFTGGGTIFSGGLNSTSNVFWFNDSTTVENVKLTGNIRGKGDFAILGNVVNLDTLQQAENNYPVSIPVKEDFINDGIVRDNPLDNDHLTMIVEKNIVNNGVWNCSWVIMNGTSDQTFTNKGLLGSSFELKANIPNATTFQWYKNDSAIDGATSETYTIYSVGNTPGVFEDYGEYYCQTNAGNSRKIIIKNENGGEEPGGVILAENFDGTEFPPNGWSVTILNTNNTWMQGNPDNNSFTNVDPTSLYSALCPWVAENQDEWLRTPVLTFPDEQIKLNFYAGYGTDYLTNATMKLNISTDGGNSWSKLWEAEVDSSGWAWREIFIDLSAYKNNSNVMLAWQYVGNDGDLVGIDNVEIIYGTVDVEENEAKLPTEYALNQNYPNPFNPSTVISYALPKQEMVTLSIYNILGEEVAELVNEMQSAGNYKVNFDASKLSTGAYIYRLQAGNFIQTKKMLLLK